MNSSEGTSGGGKRRQHVGAAFEEQAGRFYINQGFTIIARNWRTGHKEIDLIVRRDDLIVFVEVKASFSQKFGHPVSRVTADKQQNLIDAAQQYLIISNIENCDLRFDVVTFTNGELEHFPNAFPAA